MVLGRNAHGVRNEVFWRTRITLMVIGVTVIVLERNGDGITNHCSITK
jgi:hypothetical protein